MELFKRFRFKENEVDPDWHMVQNQRDEDGHDSDKYLKDLEEEEEDLESYGIENLKEMSMPILWQRAVKLGVSKEGDRAQLIDRILKAQKEQEGAPEETFAFGILEQLSRARERLKEFEQTREAIRTQIESISKLVPKLYETKELLEKHIHGKEGKIAEITELIPKLEEKKRELQEDIERKQEEKELLEKDIHGKEGKIAEITELIPKLDQDIKKIRDSIELKQKKISKIEEQIRQISELESYDISLLSTLAYTEMLSERK